MEKQEDKKVNHKMAKLKWNHKVAKADILWVQ